MIQRLIPCKYLVPSRGKTIQQVILIVIEPFNFKSRLDNFYWILFNLKPQLLSNRNGVKFLITTKSTLKKHITC